MTDPKYAGLPGIATDEPDFYESGELPEEDQNNFEAYDEEIPNEAIEKIDINVRRSYDKFKNKVLIDKKGVDFSIDFGYKSRIGYDAETIDWEILPKEYRKDETVIQKYQRLQLEFRELLEEINELEKTSNDFSVMANNLDKISETIQLLDRISLNNILEKGKKNQKSTDFDNLLHEVVKFKESNNALAQNNDCITFSLKCYPQKMKFDQNQRIAELEQRIHQLEKLIGFNSQEKLNFLLTRLQQTTLIGIAQNLAAQVAMLEPKNLDYLEKRIDVIIQKTNIAHNQAKVGDSDNFHKKLNEVYDFVGNYDVLMKILPKTVSRFEALENFHNEALDLASKVSSLGYNLEENDKKIEKLKSNLEDTVKNFESNYEVIKSYIEKIENEKTKKK